MAVDALAWALAYFARSCPAAAHHHDRARDARRRDAVCARRPGARPDERVFLFTGTGVRSQRDEVDTAVRHNLPVIVIVSNNAGW